MKKLYIYFFIFNVTVILIGLGAYVYYTYLDGTIEPIMEVSSMSTVKNEYKIGEMVQINVSFCRNKRTPTSYYWKMYNHVATEFAPKKLTATQVGETGCHEKIADIELIPKNTESGPHYMELTVIYEVNSLRKIEYKFKTNEFNVIK